MLAFQTEAWSMYHSASLYQAPASSFVYIPTFDDPGFFVLIYFDLIALI